MGRYYPKPKVDLSRFMKFIELKNNVVTFAYKGTIYYATLKNPHGLEYFTFKDNAYVIQSDKIKGV